MPTIASERTLLRWKDIRERKGGVPRILFLRVQPFPPLLRSSMMFCEEQVFGAHEDEEVAPLQG